MRASIAAETAGIPSVSLVCEGFVKQADATGRGHGFDDLPLGVSPGHIDAQSAEEMIANFVDVVVDQVVAGLTASTEAPATASPPENNANASAEPTALDVVASGSIDDINRIFIERGWSEGLPVVPPTRERVEAFLAATGHDPWRQLGTATTTGRDLTVWSVAVNAVMAGCAPEHLPVLLAATEILADPHYGAEHSGNTTGADALMILGGPTVEERGFNAGPGAMREGVAANTSVGRWLRLYQRNVFGFTADEHDKATFGNPTRTVLTEHSETLADIGWEPLSADFGGGAEHDSLTMVRLNSGIIVGSVYGSTPEQMVPYLADGVARVAGWDLTHVFGLGREQFSPLLVLSPILARAIAAAGWSKADLQDALFAQARIPAWRFEKLIGEWSNLTAGRRSLADHVAAGNMGAVYGESDDPDRLVPVASDPSKYRIAVAGDPNRTNAYVLANDGPHGDWTSKVIDFTASSDLVCAVPQVTR